MNDLHKIWDTSCPLRFLVAGAWNFAFGYGVFAGLYWAFRGKVSDWLILVVATVLGITMSFLTHRFITYRSTGPWLKEYFRFYVVYGVQSVLNILMFWILVTLLKMNAYAVQFFIATSLTLASYWAHKWFSFRKGV